MTQIYCLECKNKVSARARTCPHCACPIDESTVAAAVAAASKAQARETAHTKFKSMQLISAVSLGLSMLVLSSTPHEIGNGMWLALAITGLAGLSYASIGTWCKRH